MAKTRRNSAVVRGEGSRTHQRTRKKGKKRAADEPGCAPPPSKKADVDGSDGEIVVCELSSNRRVSVRSWRGMVLVDIREFYFKGNKPFPGKKGITFRDTDTASSFVG